MIARVFDGKSEGLSRDDVLDNITLYWLTNTAISSARLYWDTRHNLPAGGFFDARGVKLPVAVSAFAEEIYQAPKSWAEKAYVKLIHYNKLPKGGHFAAWEQPELFVTEAARGVQIATLGLIERCYFSCAEEWRSPLRLEPTGLARSLSPRKPSS